MMSKPAMLGLVGLLAACGGSGTPAVDGSPDVPDTSNPDTLAPEPIAPPPPPDPVTFVFDNGGKAEITTVDGAIVFDGATYQIDELHTIYVEGESAFFDSFSDGNRVGWLAARILDEDATAAVGVLLRDPDIAQGYQPEPDAGGFSVPVLDNVSPGRAIFSGDYAGVLIQRGTVDEDGFRDADVPGAIIGGDVVLDVEFADFLSQGSFSGVIENREFRQYRDGVINTTTGLADIVIENGRFDDSGQLTADISAGEWTFLNYVGPGDDVFDTTPSTLIGQLGGDGGTVIAGTLLLEHQRYESFAPDFERSDILDHADTEIGAFVARQD